VSNTINDNDEQRAVKRAQAALDASGKWVSLAEASRLTGISVQTLASAVHSGRLPALHIPQLRGWLVRVSAVDGRIGMRKKKETK
jgi:hypothetical protein